MSDTMPMTYAEARTFQTVAYWGAECDDDLLHEEIDDAIEDMLDVMDAMPEKLTVVGYRRAKLPEDAYMAVRDVVEPALEYLDEGYGYLDERDLTQPWPELTAAAEAFVAELRRGYRSWHYEAVCTVEVDVKAWVQEHRPDWVEATP